MPSLGNLTAGGESTYAHPSLTLSLTPEMMDTLQKMSRDSGQPLGVALTRAIGLYVGALKATAEGKHVGYAATPDALEVEFTGISGPGGR